MKTPSLLAAVVFGSWLAATAAAADAPPPVAILDHEMFRVQLVMLKSGPTTTETAADDPRQAQHLAGLEALLRSRQALVADDAAVKRGRLKLEPYTGWVSKGLLPPR